MQFILNFMRVSKGSFDLQNNKYWTKQYRTKQDSTEQDKMYWREREIIFFIFEKKWIFSYFLQLYCGQKVVLWFRGGQKILFLSSPLLPLLSSPIISFHINHDTTNVAIAYILNPIKISSEQMNYKLKNNENNLRMSRKKIPKFWMNEFNGNPCVVLCVNQKSAPSKYLYNRLNRLDFLFLQKGGQSPIHCI
jgi:hypothetical protein